MPRQRLDVKSILTKENLDQWYIRDMMTIDEIRSLTGISNRRTVIDYMRKHKIKARDTNRERSLVHKLGVTDQEFSILLRNDYIDQELSSHEIANKYGVTHTVIYRYLDKYGIPRRDHKASIAISNSGSKNPKWNNGITIRKDGYILVRVPSHPAANKAGFVYQHRIVMEQHIGRYLSSNEHVHHINENTSDNRIENLKILSSSEHAKLHAQQRNKIRWSKTKTWKLLN